jgi:uncharacterized protein (TIGR03118 family)
LTLATLACVAAAQAQNAYVDTVLVANLPEYNPLNIVDPLLVNGWGIALRPPGAGGHFWISNAGTGTTTTYVGDVHSPAGFVPMYQDSLTVVDIPIGAGTLPDGRPVTEVSIPTGQVFNHSSTDFVVSGEGITAASKFIFVTGEGTISGWTEFRDAQGVLHRQTKSVITIDNSIWYDDERLIYTGAAVTDFPSGNILYVTNWTFERVEMYDHNWNPIAVPEGRFQISSPGEVWRPWNIQYLRTGPKGEGRIWVAFNKAEDPWEEYADFGAVAEFDLEGNLIRRMTQTLDRDPLADSDLRDPWGLAVAPDNFGPFSGMLLVANFGDGTIPAFDLETGDFVDFLRDSTGAPLVVDGIWGFVFGNGVALGDSNALYYAAGPNGEADGTFGSIRYIPDTCPVIEQQPVSAEAKPGSTATFSARVAMPVRMALQWQVRRGDDWVDAVDGPLAGVGELSGAQTATLEIGAVAKGASAEFRLRITNLCNFTTSHAVTLTGGAGCAADFNGDTVVNSTDVSDFVNAWFDDQVAGTLVTDWDGNGVVNSTDVSEFINAWFDDQAAGC